jgi:hypothetical protein
MTPLGLDHQLIAELSGRDSLLDGRVARFALYTFEDSVRADAEIIARSSSRFERILLTFEDVEEYHLNYDREVTFYNIERVKFFIDADQVYASFDPADERQQESDDDNDCVRARHVRGFVLTVRSPNGEPCPSPPA